ncbi:MAG TPA: hypothetical protein VGW36_00560, partial [Pyrinomonadaceae bacterium]|nr:hypothetical protein [Pyrinomonadaceae bacterium]
MRKPPNIYLRRIVENPVIRAKRIVTDKVRFYAHSSTLTNVIGAKSGGKRHNSDHLITFTGYPEMVEKFLRFR